MGNRCRSKSCLVRKDGPLKAVDHRANATACHCIESERISDSRLNGEGDILPAHGYHVEAPNDIHARHDRNDDACHARDRFNPPNNNCAHYGGEDSAKEHGVGADKPFITTCDNNHLRIGLV